MIIQIIIRFQEIVFALSDRITQHNNWKFILSLILPITALFFAFPSYEILYIGFGDGWEAILKQAENPFKFHNYHPSHQDKLVFRIVPPLLIGLLNLNIPGVLIMQAVFGSLLFYFCAKTFENILNDRINALLLTLAVSFIGAGHLSFSEIRGIFDGMALCFLVFSLTYRNVFSVFLGVLLASWTDERGLIASGFVFLFWALRLQQGHLKLFNKFTISVVAAWAFYFIGRLSLTIFLQFKTSTSGTGLSVFTNQINNFPIGFWSALEGIWLIIVIAIILLIVKKRYITAFSFGGGIIVMLIIAMSVFDISRSMAYLLPAVFIALLIIRENEKTDTIRQLVLAATLICFIYPAVGVNGSYSINWTYPFPLQILRYLFTPPAGPIIE